MGTNVSLFVTKKKKNSILQSHSLPLTHVRMHIRTNGNRFSIELLRLAPRTTIYLVWICSPKAATYVLVLALQILCSRSLSLPLMLIGFSLVWSVHSIVPERNSQKHNKLLPIQRECGTNTEPRK